MEKQIYKMFIAIFAAATAAALCLSVANGEPETESRKFLALVIGNSAYQGGILNGPDNDARDMASALHDIGFQISNDGNIPNLNQASMNSVIQNFLERVDENTVAIVYYSGHGIEDPFSKKTTLFRLMPILMHTEI
ncbi:MULTISPECIES: caspase family protein [Paraburkholderia]|nr:caspase family protein [Paraburkholderia youngii]